MSEPRSLDDMAVDLAGDIGDGLGGLAILREYLAEAEERGRILAARDDAR
jgi:hypothetical protein